ncbi:glycosyltransferase family 4 protein [bacterium]|nr:glycosyltransferase family 4 protein [bacterium]
MPRLLIFDTHPIQYRSPVFGALAQREPSLKVLFFNSAFNGNQWWFQEVGKIPRQTWELPLQEGFDNDILQTEGLGFVRTYRKLKEALLREKPDRVAVYGYYLPEHWMLRWLCARLRIPLIFVGETFQGGDWSFRRMVKTPLRRFFFRGVSRFITIGEKTQAYYRGLGIAENRLIPAKYCIDHAFFNQSEETARKTREQWRLKWGIPDDAFVLLFVGRLFERKRPQDALCLQHALVREKNAYLVMVGNGPQEDFLKEQSYGIPRVIWTGFQNQAATRDAYYGADLLFVPSEFETWGLVVNEAAACGLPALITDTCGVAGDLVQHRETGFVYPCGHVGRALEYVRKVIAEPGLAKGLGAAARDKVRAQYNVGQFADAFVKAVTV